MLKINIVWQRNKLHSHVAPQKRITETKQTYCSNAPGAPRRPRFELQLTHIMHVRISNAETITFTIELIQLNNTYTALLFNG